MFDFFVFLWKDYQIKKKTAEIDQKMNNMIDDMKRGKLTGNPARDFAKLQMERYRVCGHLRR